MSAMLRAPTTRQLNLGLAALRSVTGLIFMAHGAQKLFVFGIAGVTGAFGQMGIPLPVVVAPAVAVLEFLGGLALIVGAGTRLAAAGLLANMLGAIMLVHLRAGFFLPEGVEFALSLLGSAALLAVVGAGGWSVDAVLAGRAAERQPELNRAARGGSRRAA